MTTVVNQVKFQSNNLFCAFLVNIQAATDQVVLVFPQVGGNITVTISSGDVGNINTNTLFNVTINGSTLTVWKSTASGTATLSQQTSANIANLNNLMFTATSGAQVSILQTGAFSLSPDAMYGCFVTS